MIDIQTEKRLFKSFVWLMAAIALLIILSSCSAATSHPGTPTAKPTLVAARSAMMTDPTTALPSPTPAQSCRVSTGYNAGFLNLRAGAGTEFAVIRVLHEGEVLQVITRGAWLEVIDGQETRGYVHARYCQVQP
jgi:uncharacterized protein YraI